MFNGCGQAAEQIVSNKIYAINTPSQSVARKDCELQRSWQTDEFTKNFNKNEWAHTRLCCRGRINRKTNGKKV